MTDTDQVAKEKEEDEESAEDETEVEKIQTTFFSFSVKMKVEGPSPLIIIHEFLLSAMISILLVKIKNTAKRLKASFRENCSEI